LVDIRQKLVVSSDFGQFGGQIWTDILPYGDEKFWPIFFLGCKAMEGMGTSLTTELLLTVNGIFAFVPLIALPDLHKIVLDSLPLS